MADIREQIAREIFRKLAVAGISEFEVPWTWESAESDPDVADPDGLRDLAFAAADRILALPEIVAALKAKQREETIHRSGNLGPSVSTNRRTPVAVLYFTYPAR